MRKRLLPVIAALVVAFAGAAYSASPAKAWYAGNAWVIVGNWNCFAGGSVTGVFGAVDNMWSGGDWGDNVLYPRVRIGDYNTFNGRAYCNRPFWQGGGYWVNIVWKVFRPTAPNQNFWF